MELALWRRRGRGAPKPSERTVVSRAARPGPVRSQPQCLRGPHPGKPWLQIEIRDTDRRKGEAADWSPAGPLPRLVTHI